MSLLTDVILFKRNCCILLSGVCLCSICYRVFTCARIVMRLLPVLKLVLELARFHFQPLVLLWESFQLKICSVQPRVNLPNVHSTAGCQFWKDKDCTKMEVLWENGRSVWKQKICIGIQRSSQNVRRNGWKRNGGVEKVPSPTSPRQARSGLLHGFEVSPPCTFQSHYLHFYNSLKYSQMHI